MPETQVTPKTRLEKNCSSIPAGRISIRNQKDMFRIKTALLACLLLVAATSSVSALDQTQEPRLSSFGEFLAVNHQSAAQGAQVLAAITLRANLSIQDAKASRFSMPRIYINGIQQLLAGYGN